MKKNVLQAGILIAIFFSLLLGCAKDVEINYLLNGHDWPASAFKPRPEDTTKVLSLYAGDTIYITDVSEPRKSISSRHWDIDGDGVWDTDFQNKDDFYTIFNQVGLQKTSLCLNGKEQCIIKWINVKEKIIFETFNPTLAFVKPSEPFSKNETGYLNIKVQTQNVYAKEELRLSIGGRAQDFYFDEAEGVLRAKNLELAIGENTIEVQTVTEDEMNAQEQIIVNYKPSAVADLDNPRVIDKSPAPANKPDLAIIIAKPNNGARTTKPRIRVEFKAINVVMRDNFQITHNGKSIRNDRFNHHTDGLWKGTLHLETGRNTIEIKASTDKGTASDSREIFYEGS